MQLITTIFLFFIEASRQCCIFSKLIRSFKKSLWSLIALYNTPHYTTPNLWTACKNENSLYILSTPCTETAFYADRLQSKDDLAERPYHRHTRHENSAHQAAIRKGIGKNPSPPSNVRQGVVLITIMPLFFRAWRPRRQPLVAEDLDLLVWRHQFYGFTSPRLLATVSVDKQNYCGAFPDFECATWLVPLLVSTDRSMKYTPGGGLRQPVFKGLY